MSVRTEYAALFLLGFTLFLSALYPGLATEDSPEMLLAALNLDVTHPPGYPLQVLLGHLFLLVPAGSLPFRLNLLSALAAAGALVLAFSSMRALSAMLGAGRGPSLIWALAGTVALAVSHTFLWQSQISDKYALHLLFAAGIMRAVLPGGPSPMALALLLGLGAAHHPLVIFMAPLLWLRRGELRGRRTITLALLFLALPLTLKAAYPAVRAAADPPVNWGRPTHATALAGYLTVGQYSGKMRPSIPVLLSRTREAAGFYRHQFGRGLLAFALAATVAAFIRMPTLAAPFGLALAASFLFGLNIRLDPFLAETYHCNAFLLLAVLLGSGLAGLPRGRWAGVLAGVVLAVSVTGAVLRLPTGSAGRDYGLYDLDRHILLSAPRGAFLFAGSDYDHFAVRYLTGPAGLRPDLEVEDMPGNARRGDSWPALLARVAPGRRPGPEVSADMAARTSSLVSFAPRSACLAFSMLGDEFTAFPARTRGLVLIPLTAACAPRPDPGLKPWRGFTFRWAFGPRSSQPWNRTIRMVHGRALDRTALSLAAEGRGREAVATATLRSRLLPGEPESWFSMGVALAAAGRADAAFACLERACLLGPGYADPLLFMLDSVRAGRAWDRLPALTSLVRGFLGSAPFPSLPDSAAPAARIDLMARALAEEMVARGDDISSGTGRSAGSLSPDDPRRRGAALTCYMQAVRLNDAWETPLGRATEMAILLQAREQAWGLVRHWRRAFPRSATALLSEATLRVIEGDSPRAAVLLEGALRLDPGLEDARRLLNEIRPGKR